MRQVGLPRLAKRTFDLSVATFGIAVALPLMAATAVVVRLGLGSPVLFRQQRPGYKERPFIVLKFRTMTDERGPDGELLPDAERLPALGRFLRKTSLDELPQLFNVLRGDISLVGPRPLLMDYLSRYSAEEKRRHDVMPGITGWSQVHGRNATTWEERFAQDLYYVDNWSLSLDVVVLAKTVLVVLGGGGTSQQGHATMPNFMGHPNSAP